ncbi:MAG: diguanylate cyclase [Candidatus Omnitrophota bacterium]|nr:MAG: diguanylate cyclase [Candidatus Omnitrophota bacterium]
MDKIIKILIISSDAKLREVLHFCFDGWGYEVVLWDSCKEDIGAIKRISPDVIVIDVHSARLSDLKICTLLKNDFLTSSIPVITFINKRHLRKQLLRLREGVDDYLIKPPDPLDLRIRIEMAVRRSQFSLYANPLTGLPGARMIEEVLKERITGRIESSVGYLDIDNFKYFNDVYGYLKGDNVIMHTAYMLYGIIRRFGASDDFIAHIGGDDFVFIVTPDKFETICQNFIYIFDRIVPFHYSAEDRMRGFVIARDRTHRMKKIPLISVSIAIVNVGKSFGIRNNIQINERIAEIKKYLKTMPGSKYMVDRRNYKGKQSLGPRGHKKNEFAQTYKPLGQILLERNIISSEQLEEALRIHWKRGVVLGEVLKELGFIQEEQLQEALGIQEHLPSRFPSHM